MKNPFKIERCYVTQFTPSQIRAGNLYNKYLRDFFTHNPDRSMEEARHFRKLKKALPLRRHVYEKSDLDSTTIQNATPRLMQTNAKLAQLLPLLQEAEALAAQFTGSYSNSFLGAEEFYQALSISISQLRKGHIHQLKKLALWFAPTCDWDAFIGKEGAYLANKIDALLSELRVELNV